MKSNECQQHSLVRPGRNRPRNKAFDTLKVGDSIHARYTEAIAISVEKP